MTTCTVCTTFHKWGHKYTVLAFPMKTEFQSLNMRELVEGCKKDGGYWRMYWPMKLKKLPRRNRRGV